MRLSQISSLKNLNVFFHNFNFRVTGRIRTDVNNIHSVAPKPLGHSHHIFERHGRIGLPSPAWQAGIITTIRMPQNFYNHRLVEHPRLTILSSKTTTIFIILYPHKDSNPDHIIRNDVCIHYTIEAFGVG